MRILLVKRGLWAGCVTADDRKRRRFGFIGEGEVLFFLQAYRRERGRGERICVVRLLRVSVGFFWQEGEKKAWEREQWKEGADGIDGTQEETLHVVAGGGYGSLLVGGGQRNLT